MSIATDKLESIRQQVQYHLDHAEQKRLSPAQEAALKDQIRERLVAEMKSAEGMSGALPFLVVGDVNATMATTVVASKLHIPVAHVEAGLRSFNMQMPEEINRVLTDRLSALLFCPTETAVKNLAAEGIDHDQGVQIGGQRFRLQQPQQRV